MNKVILEKIEQYKNSKKDDEKTKQIVERYLDSKYGYISSLEELFMNLTTGVNAHLINYELAEQEFNRIRNIETKENIIPNWDESNKQPKKPHSIYVGMSGKG